MAKQHFFPTDEGSRIQWLRNYEQKFPIHAPSLGMAGEVGSTLLDITYALWLLETWHPAIQKDAKEASSYKKYMLDAPPAGEPPAPAPVGSVFAPPGLVIPGIFKRLFAQIARIKLQPGYTRAIGEDLGIIGPEEQRKDASAATKVKTRVLDGTPNQMVELAFSKDGHEGVYIESRVNGGAWAQLGIDSQSPYTDNRPLLVPGTAETREYRVRYWDKGTPNGNFTPVIKVTVGA
jgi:hypothetical protein